MNVYDFYLPGLVPDPAQNIVTIADIGEFKALAMRLCGGWTEGYPSTRRLTTSAAIRGSPAWFR